MYQQPPSMTRQIVYQVVLFLISIAVLYPVLWVIKMALTPGQAFSMDPWPFPTGVSFENFSAVIGDPYSKDGWLFGKQLLNSLVVSLLTAAVGVVLSCTAGYAMSRFAFPGRDAGMSFFLVTQMFPGVVMAIPLYILMQKLNLLDSVFGLTLAYAATAIPFCTWNLKGYFDTIPKDLEEAAPRSRQEDRQPLLHCHLPSVGKIAIRLFENSRSALRFDPIEESTPTLSVLHRSG